MQRADLIESGNRNEATVLGFYIHLMKRDIDAFSALWTKDGSARASPLIGARADEFAPRIVAASGRAYDQRYVFVFKLRDGRIVLNREHINPIALMQAFA